MLSLNWLPLPSLLIWKSCLKDLTSLQSVNHWHMHMGIISVISSKYYRKTIGYLFIGNRSSQYYVLWNKPQNQRLKRKKNHQDSRAIYFWSIIIILSATIANKKKSTINGTRRFNFRIQSLSDCCLKKCADIDKVLKINLWDAYYASIIKK